MPRLAQEQRVPLLMSSPQPPPSTREPPKRSSRPAAAAVRRQSGGRAPTAHQPRGPQRPKTPYNQNQALRRLLAAAAAAAAAEVTAEAVTGSEVGRRHREDHLRRDRFRRAVPRRRGTAVRCRGVDPSVRRECTSPMRSWKRQPRSRRARCGVNAIEAVRGERGYK